MKTTDEIEKMGRNYANSGDGDKFPALDFLSPMDWDEIELSIVDAYSAAYRQAQQDMMEDAAKDFEEWFFKTDEITLRGARYEMQLAFTAGRLSALKEQKVNHEDS